MSNCKKCKNHSECKLKAKDIADKCSFFNPKYSKEYEKGYKDGYEKAIDEFAEKLSLAFDETIEEYGFYPENLIRQVAEQLRQVTQNE